MSRPRNASAAVGAARSMPVDSLDYFPTPPWATRALFLVAEGPARDLDGHPQFRSATPLVCWEPACGEEHMARPLRERFPTVVASDVHDYGTGHQLFDFLHLEGGVQLMHAPSGLHPDGTADWIVTNPPFVHAARFARIALQRARVGVAFFVRLQFAESLGRYRDLFRDTPPAAIAQFVERVGLVPGRLDPRAALPTAYAWFVWRRPADEISDRYPWGLTTRFSWIPPCRDSLERAEDYPERMAAEDAA